MHIYIHWDLARRVSRVRELGMVLGDGGHGVFIAKQNDVEKVDQQAETLDIEFVDIKVISFDSFIKDGMDGEPNAEPIDVGKERKFLEDTVTLPDTSEDPNPDSVFIEA